MCLHTFLRKNVMKNTNSYPWKQNTHFLFQEKDDNDLHHMILLLLIKLNYIEIKIPYDTINFFNGMPKFEISIYRG